ncbi:MAG: hypothetical protein V4726_19360 [Verrucomicrobiota bacterium]
MTTHTLNVRITGFTDSNFPGWVECILRDAEGHEWTIRDKLPIFTKAPLNARSVYPQPGVIACVIVRQWVDDSGRVRCIIGTERPWGVFAKDGQTQFEVFLDQLTAEASE